MRNHRILIPLLPLILLLLLIQSCSQTKYLPEDAYLLNRTQVDYDIEDIPREEINSYIKQKPNKRLLGWKFWLTVYNMSGENPSKWYNRYLKKIGEAPVEFDETLRDNTTQQLDDFLTYKGYCSAEVSDTTIYNGRKASVRYTIDAGNPYFIRNIDYFFEDGSLSKYIMSDSVPPIIKVGDQFDTDKFKAEQLRIQDILRNQGYFNFSSGYVYFQADTTVGNHQVDLTMGIKNYPVRLENGKLTYRPHPKYKIRNVYMKIPSSSSVHSSLSQMVDADTAVYDDVYVITEPGIKIRHGIITQKNYIFPGSKYSARRESQTYRNLNSLSAFRLVDYTFEEIEGDSNLLDCEIRLVPAVKQAFTGAIEGTSSGGNIGAAGNVSFQHRNLFGGSERFDLTFQGAIERIPDASDDAGGTSDRTINTMQELGVEAELDIPKFLLPFKTEQFIRKYNPRTSVTLSYSYQKQPYYTRSTLQGGFGYRWRGNRYLTHAVFPFETSMIYIHDMDEDWLNDLRGTYLYYSYIPHFINDVRYSMVFTNQRLNKSIDFQYVRFNVETAGNLMNLGYRALKEDTQNDTLTILQLDVAQYLKSDVEARFYHYLNGDNALVFRAFAGAALPYMNSAAIPFEKQFFSGGANSVRAWQVKSLGPGSYIRDTIYYPNQTADLKLEANAEFRFNLVWKLKGAVFLDAGNIWSLSGEEDREGAIFDFKRFYKEFAVGTGVGVRFDFKYFIFRVDLGIPLVDPSLPEGQRWVPKYKDLGSGDLGYNIAIGYPF